MEIRKFFETGGMVPEENPWENFPNWWKARNLKKILTLL